MIRKTTLVQDSQKEYRIKIEYDTIHDMWAYQRVLSLPGRKYHPDNDCWSIPIYEESVNSLILWEFEIDPRIRTYMESLAKKRQELTDMEIPGLKGELFKFQKQGVTFLEEKKGRALIADEMGTGKTIQSLAWLQLHPEKRPVVIVVPASVKLNWQKECNTWMTEPKSQILSGTKPDKITGEIIIINYDILYAWVKELQKINPKVLILDESHKIKSSSTTRTKSVKKLAKGISHVICLSGTPIENKPIEIFNSLKIIDESLFPHFNAFVNQFCDPKYNGYGWDYSGASHTQELHQRLTSTVMLRRLKKDIMPDLPPKTYSFVPLELDNAKEYYAAERDFIEWTRQNKGDDAANRITKTEQIARIEGLKQIVTRGKLKQVKEWINDFLESDQKLIIFATHVFVINELMAEYKDIAVKLDGSCNTDKKREQAKVDFQTKDEIRLFIGNIMAAGESINLTAASNIIFIELPWKPSSIKQASDRAHRYTQKFAVNIFFLLVIGTIEEKIAKIIDRKLKTVDAVIDGKVTEQENLLHELMKLYK
jgi:SWI/SNF-related matrix-associated actin-dependent regulator 1 of chromatin subfamily A